MPCGTCRRSIQLSTAFRCSARPLPDMQINLGCFLAPPLAGRPLKLDRCSVAGPPFPELDRRGQTSRLRSRCAGLAAPACALLTVLAHRFGIMDRCVRLAAFRTRRSCRRGLLPTLSDLFLPRRRQPSPPWTSKVFRANLPLSRAGFDQPREKSVTNLKSVNRRFSLSTLLSPCF